MSRINREIITKIKKSLRLVDKNLEKEAVIFIDAKGAHWVNELANEFISKKGIPKEDFVEWIKLGSSHLQNLSYDDIDIHMMKLPEQDVVVFLKHGQKETVSKKYKITQRERELLRYLVRGFSNKKIADLMKIGPGTVNTHLDHIYSKLGCSNRLTTCFTALKNGLVLPTCEVQIKNKS
jgi:DNA-binding NarL/FixJ family response regulator